MSRTLDGIDFDIPPTAGQVMALAQLHRKKLDAAIFHKEIHLAEQVCYLPDSGNYCGYAGKYRFYRFI